MPKNYRAEKIEHKIERKPLHINDNYQIDQKNQPMYLCKINYDESNVRRRLQSIPSKNRTVFSKVKTHSLYKIDFAATNIREDLVIPNKQMHAWGYLSTTQKRGMYKPVQIF